MRSPTKDKTLRVRVSSDEVALLEKAARKDDLTLSAWARQKLLQIARKTLGTA